MTAYRELGPDEIVHKGDEYFYPSDQTWVVMQWGGEAAREYMYSRFRRKITWGKLTLGPACPTCGCAAKAYAGVADVIGKCWWCTA